MNALLRDAGLTRLRSVDVRDSGRQGRLALIDAKPRGMYPARLGLHFLFSNHGLMAR
jgi:hypothetical protein